VNNLQVLRDFRHVNPDGDDESKELQDTNVSIVHLEVFIFLSLENYRLESFERFTRLLHDDCHMLQLNLSWALFQNSLLLNVAACYQRLHEYIKSIETCNKVISFGAHVELFASQPVYWSSLISCHICVLLKLQSLSLQSQIE